MEGNDSQQAGSLKTGHREAQEQTKSTDTTDKKQAQTAACSETVTRLGTHGGQGPRHKGQSIRG